MRDRYFIDEPTMRRLIASLDPTQNRDVVYLQRFVAKLCGLQSESFTVTPGKNPSARQSG